MRLTPVGFRIALALPLIALAACDDEPAGPDLPGPPASLTLSTDTVRLAALGAAERLTATVADADGIALGDVAVVWSNAEPGVATVDGSGRVEAVGVGDAEVIAAAGDARDTAAVIVTQTASSVRIAPALGELHAVGDSTRLEAIVRDANGNIVAGAAVVWSSADTMVATVDGAGWVFARANGATTVEAAAGAAAAEAAVLVRQIVASVAVSPAAVALGQGETVQLDAAAADSNGVPIAGATVVWATSAPDVATVDAAGRVEATGWGAGATITATVDGVGGSADVRVRDQITFTSYRDGNSEIYVMHADGSGPTRLTYESDVDSRPAWSPDGRELAFFSTRDATADVYVMDADGSDVRRVTGSGGVDSRPAWSPDGSTLAFQSTRDGDAEIYAIAVDGSSPTNLTTAAANDIEPAWSPDGTRIAFASDRDPGDGTTDYEVYVMNADGSAQTQLTDVSPDDRFPAWSPDGTKLAFASARDGDYEIWVMNPDGSNPVQITDNTEIDEAPAWSPDGSRIAFGSYRDGNYDIYVMDADGSNQTRLTDDALRDQSPAWRPVP